MLLGHILFSLDAELPLIIIHSKQHFHLGRDIMLLAYLAIYEIDLDLEPECISTNY